MDAAITIPGVFGSRAEVMGFFAEHRDALTPAQVDRLVAIHDALPLAKVSDPPVADGPSMEARFHAAWRKAKASTEDAGRREHHMAASVAELLGNGSTAYARGVHTLYGRYGMKAVNRVALVWARRPMETAERFRRFRAEVEALGTEKGKEGQETPQKVA